MTRIGLERDEGNDTKIIKSKKKRLKVEKSTEKTRKRPRKRIWKRRRKEREKGVSRRQ